MPEPSMVHIDAALTNVSVAYRNEAFLSDILAPSVPVRKQSDRYYIHDPRRERFRPGDDRRAPGAHSTEVDFTLSTDSYFCDDHALSSVIPDEERDNADPVVQPAIDRTEFLTDRIALNKEIALAVRLLDGDDIPGDDLSGTDQWSDYDHSDPVAAVEGRKGRIHEACQVVPNTLVLSTDVYQKVRLHPVIAEQVKYTGMGMAGPEALAQMFDVERVLVARSFKNTAGRGQAAVLEPVWKGCAILCHIPERPTMRRAALGYTFVWTLAPGSLGGYAVESWRENARKADLVRVQRYYDQKIIAPGACWVWKNAVA